ncbi:MAG: CoA transferase [Chloroflexi bacterium]|nr:CoA transferase [Chloroflexota bacterium]MCI0577705.1 CoA transferase [Chloroflexota bacterium]
MNQTSRPLDNIRVVDLTEALAGPVCAMILGDLGAEVIKVERPGRGDQARGYGPPFAEGESAYFMSLNRNKRSLTLDVTAAEGQEIMQRLLAGADVFLLNMPRQSSWQKYGFDYETISAGNPGIIVAAISGYGHTGPKAGDPGYDVIAQAESGTMSLTGEPDGPPTRFPTPMADMTTGLYATIGILAALHARRQSGRGQLLDLSLLESQVSWLANLVPAYFLTGRPPQRIGNAHPMLVPYRLYQARDRLFNVGVGTDSLWQRFCQAIGRPELAGDPRFKTNADRVRNRAELEPILDEHFAQGEAAEWLARLHEARIPCGPVNGLPDVLADEQFLARGGVVELPHPLLGSVKVLANPIHFSETPPTYRRHPPLLGEHSEEILAELGYDAAAVAGLRARGVV